MQITRRAATATLSAIAALAAVTMLTLLPATAASAVDDTDAQGVQYNIISGTTAEVVGYTGSSTSVVIPPTINISGTDYTVTSIGMGAFDPLAAAGGQNTGSLLTSVSLPNTLTFMDGNSFARNNITTVVLPDSLTVVGATAFYQNQVISVTFGNAVTVIQEGAFVDDPMTSVTLPPTLTEVDAQAFQNVPLTSITIPSGVTTIGDDAFNDGTLASVTFTGAAPSTVGVDPFGAFLPQPTITYPWRFGAPQTVGGYTSPTWFGYPTQALATVTFNGNGGSTPAAESALVGSTVTAPSTTRSGYSFAGWFTAATGGTAFDFSTALTADATVFARWTATPGLASTGVDARPAILIGTSTLALGVILLAVALVRRRRTKRS